MHGLVWTLNSEDDYEAACRRCEIEVQLTVLTKLQIVTTGLKQDRRVGVGKGRTLCAEILDLRLRRGDRLEPSSQLPNVSLFEEAPLGITIIFWRQTAETITRHRNPVFCRELGVSAQRSLTIDSLHAFYYGPLKLWCQTALWFLLLANVFGNVGTQEEQNVFTLLKLFFFIHKYVYNISIVLYRHFFFDENHIQL